MTDLSPACVICGGDAELGYLDAACFTKLASTLRQIEDEAAILETAPSMQQRTGSGGGGLASQRSPVVLDAIVARDPRRGTGRIGWDDADPWGLDDTASVPETLHSRARTVEEESGDPLPASVTVSATRDYLTRQLTWICMQPWVDEMFTEMRDLLKQLQRTNKTSDEKPIGLCHLPRYDSTCGGRIWQREQERPLWRVKGDRCTREKVKVSDGPAYCERCRNTWDDPADLDRLFLIEEQRVAELARPKTADGRPMLTADELVAGGTVSSVSNVRVRAHRMGITAVNGHYDPHWFSERMAG